MNITTEAECCFFTTGLFFSFPVTIDPMNKEWKIVQGLSLDEFAKSKIDTTTQVGSYQMDNDMKLTLGTA